METWWLIGVDVVADDESHCSSLLEMGRGGTVHISLDDNLNIRIKTEPITAGAEATVYICPAFGHIKPDIYRYILSIRDRLGSYAEIRNIFRDYIYCTVYSLCWVKT